MIPKNDQLTDILHNEEPDPAFIKYKTSTLTTSAANSIKLKLEKLMTEHQLYQREELRLQDVADQVGLHRNQVSQVINENYNLNFLNGSTGTEFIMLRIYCPYQSALKPFPR